MKPPARIATGENRKMKRDRLVQFMNGGVGPGSQSAALCWRMHRGRVEVLLVTSRDTGRWLLPKGWPIDGLSPAGSAGVEAWEEAGVVGSVREEPVGFFGYDKVLSAEESLPCIVSVHPLRVERLARRFPERKQRSRKWFSAAKAARKVAEPELRDMLERLAETPALLEPGAQA